MSLSSNTALFDSHIVRWEIPPEIEEKERAAILSTCEGKAKAYSLKDFEKLGSLFVGHGTPVYEGMIIGESSTEHEWNVNPTKEKKLSNVRAAGKDEVIRLTPHKPFKVEDAIAYIKEDELVEITPKSVRIRKVELNAKMRKVRNKQPKK